MGQFPMWSPLKRLPIFHREIPIDPSASGCRRDVFCSSCTKRMTSIARCRRNLNLGPSQSSSTLLAYREEMCLSLPRGLLSLPTAIALSR